MEINKKKRIESYTKKTISADNPRDNWNAIKFTKDWRCVGCKTKLVEGKNIHMGFRMAICKNCRLEYLDSTRSINGK